MWGKIEKFYPSRSLIGIWLNLTVYIAIAKFLNLFYLVEYEVEFPDLANQNSRQPIKFEFPINSNLITGSVFCLASPFWDVMVEGIRHSTYEVS